MQNCNGISYDDEMLQDCRKQNSTSTASFNGLLYQIFNVRHLFLNPGLQCLLVHNYVEIQYMNMMWSDGGG